MSPATSPVRQCGRLYYGQLRARRGVVVGVDRNALTTLLFIVALSRYRALYDEVNM